MKSRILLVPGRDHAVVVGELAVDDLADELDVGEAEADLRGEDVDGHEVVDLGEQLAELEHRLAREDHLLPLVVAFDREARPRQPVAVGGHGLQRALVGDEQHAVEVVADVLLRHRELGAAQEAAQLALRQRQRLQLVLPEADARIVGRRQRLQVEARAAGAHRHLRARRVDVEHGVVGQRAQQVLHLARGDGDRLALGAGPLRKRGDLHLEVGRRHVEPAVLLLEQHIRQNRQRMASFDDAGHRLQRFQQRITGYLL